MFEHFFFLTAPEIKTGTDPGKKPPNSHCLPVVWRFCLCQVRMKGLEPPRLSAPDPKSGAATNYATSAKLRCKDTQAHFSLPLHPKFDYCMLEYLLDFSPWLKFMLLYQPASDLVWMPGRSLHGAYQGIISPPS
jgi:hypothetical protein